MADPFVTALAVLHGAAGAVDAAYQSQDGPPLAIRVVHTQPDRISQFGDGRVVQATHEFVIRRADVDRPSPGDLITIETGTFRLLGDPRLDVEGLSWTIGATNIRT